MKRKEIQAAVEAETKKFSDALVKLTDDEVRAIYAAQVQAMQTQVPAGTLHEAFQGTRTELSAALQLRNPAPHSHDPVEHDALTKDANGRTRALTIEERNALHDKADATVKDEHRLLSDYAKRLDPYHDSARQFVQKMHATAIWREVARALAAAGIVDQGGAS